MSAFTPQQLEAGIAQALKSGNTEMASKLASELKNVMAAPSAGGPVLAHEELVGGRVADMSTLDKVGLGLKQAGMKALTGVADLADTVSPQGRVRDGLQAAGDYFDSDTLKSAAGFFPSRPEFIDRWRDENKLREQAVQGAGLPAQAADFAGSIVPEIAAAVGTRGTSLLPRSLAQGATAFGTTDGGLLERSVAGGLSGGMYGAGGSVGGVANAGESLYKKMAQPFSRDGRMGIVRDVFNDFSINPKGLSKNLGNPERASLPGFRYTTAEAIPGDAGLAQLQRSSMSKYPEFQKMYSNRRDSQNGVIERNLSEMSGLKVNPKTNMNAFDTAMQQRTLNASRNYGQAENTPFIFGSSAAKRRDSLLKRPIVKEAIAGARNNQANAGRRASPEGSMEGLQQVRNYMADHLASLRKPGAQSSFSELNGLTVALRDMDRYLANVNPAFGKAQRAFAKDSIPINQMNVANALRQKVTPAINEFGDQTASRLNAASFAKALRDRGGRDMDDSRALVKEATGLNKPLDAVLNGQQLHTVEGIGKALSRRNHVEGAVKNSGESITAQLGNQQDILDRAVFPFFSSSTAIPLSRIVGSALGDKFDTVKRLAQKDLARALIDPRFAKKAVDTPVKKNVLSNASKNFAYAGGLGASILDYRAQNN